MNKKTLKINISKLSIGGMERAFLNFLNLSNIVKESDTTILIGYVTDANLIQQIPKNVKYHIIAKKWNLFGKIKTVCYLAFEIIKTTLKNNQYDCSIAYSPFHGSFAKLTRNESHNNVIFVHFDFLSSYKHKTLEHLKRKVQFEKFSKIICVSKKAEESFKKIFPYYNGKIFTIHNFINSQEIIKKSKEPIDFKKRVTTFLNICRHEKDENKKVSRILWATRQLKKDGKKFEVILIGSGKEDIKYKSYINNYDLDNYVKMLGSKSNPFPYFLQSDAIILSSAYEGYSIVLDEARVLKLPIISTDVGDAKEITSKGYGILCRNSREGVYWGMKTFLEKPQQYASNFSANKFNAKINQQLSEAIFSE